MSNLFFKILGFVFAVAIVFFVWSYYTPLDSESDAEIQTVVIESGSSKQDIATQLHDAGIIRNKRIFSVASFIFSSSLKAGEYELSSAMSIKDVIKELSKGEKVEEVRVVIPEGLNIEEMDELFVESGLLEEGEFLEEASLSTAEVIEKYGSEFEFLGSVDADTLEGFLFPDTYDFFADATAEDVVEKLLITFRDKTKELRAEIPAGQDLLSIITIASLVQGEVQTHEDMKLVAGIIENRFEAGMPLQLDITLVYITGRRDVRPEDKNIRSAYNTYRNKGLPPGPINNPGLDAIDATLNPTMSEYHFYISTPETGTIFAETLEEHNANIQKYLR